MALKEQLQTAMKDAMRAKDKARLGVLRMILADIKRVEVDERIELDDARVLAVLDKMQKQRRDSFEQFEAAGRQDLADTEKAELEVIAQFLPAALSESELNELIDSALAATGAASMADMGKVMGVLKPQVQGRADMGQVSQQVKARLG
ncbi:GatB/YqeY domain-containing protein [Natronospirillum operosum]|uniref:GatB/YqeY domain-containing protein n=1 Tax=Natronospirillum operosum TaxID=2759953 RepID=A0A4Z0WEB3_9GAMM|nr:GatB/YqeY domain-containing protein [Natronospirillum operosum]TGG92491.1 GatB/YqeY domain-containing protein [Natronospirillum operosum]